MVLDKQKAIEEIIKTTFSLNENQIFLVSGVIRGMHMANNLQSSSQKENKKEA